LTLQPSPRTPHPSRWRQRVRSSLAALMPRRLLLIRGPKEDCTVCLTFDDGPHPDYTPRLLDILKEHGARATFFVIGANVERHPELVRRMIADGHAIGNHTYTHGEPEKTSAWQLLQDTERNTDLLASI